MNFVNQRRFFRAKALRVEVLAVSVLKHGVNKKNFLKVVDAITPCFSMGTENDVSMALAMTKKIKVFLEELSHVEWVACYLPLSTRYLLPARYPLSPFLARFLPC